jgi:hypothetical protein
MLLYDYLHAYHYDSVSAIMYGKVSRVWINHVSMHALQMKFPTV